MVLVLRRHVVAPRLVMLKQIGGLSWNQPNSAKTASLNDLATTDDLC